MEENNFSEKLKRIAERYEGQKSHILTEEATKNALVMPFIQAMGYDVFNPGEVVPEFTADVGVKQGEKVDYAIKKDGKVIMLIECKTCGTNINEAHFSQLYRYFAVVEARFAILTNGTDYRFYADLDNKNKMDDKPFFEFNILDIKDDMLEELKKFGNNNFCLDSILSSASDLKYTNGFKQLLASEFDVPSEEFVHFLVSKVYGGRITAGVKKQFSRIVKKAVNQFVSEKVSRKLASALDINKAEAEAIDDELDQQLEESKKKIITTDEELEAFYIIKGIVGDIPGVFERIDHKDTQSYFGIMLDNTRGWFCRLSLTQDHKIMQLRQSSEEYSSIELSSLTDIYSYRDDIVTACKFIIEKRS